MDVAASVFPSTALPDILSTRSSNYFREIAWMVRVFLTSICNKALPLFNFLLDCLLSFILIYYLCSILCSWKGLILTCLGMHSISMNLVESQLQAATNDLIVIFIFLMSTTWSNILIMICASFGLICWWYCYFLCLGEILTSCM